MSCNYTEPYDVTKVFIQGELISGQWKFDDGQAMTYLPWNWIAGQPEGAQPVLYFNYAAGGMWHDVLVSSSPKAFLCEKVVGA
jgi:hypothetical protein